MLPHWLISILSQRLVADACTRYDKAACAYFVAAICRTNSNQFEFVRQIAATMIFTCRTRPFVAATCRGDVSQRFVASFVSAFNNDRATTTRHNYSKWRRPGNLKTKASVFDIYIFQTQTPSFEKLGTKFIVKTMFCGLELFSCFNGGFP